MAQIDLKECTIKVFDGTLGAATLDSTATDSDLTFTANSRHIGSDKISVTFVDPATASASLSVAVSGRAITVNLATSTASAITTTAAEVQTAIQGDTDANALVAVTFAETSGAGIVDAQAEVTLDGQQSVEVRLGEGNAVFTEHSAKEFKLDRGQLYTVKSADEQPVDLTVDAMWEYLTAVTASGTPTVDDAMKRRGEAAAWVSTADDQCQPYCVDIEIWNAPDCTAVEDELIMFEEFYVETADHDLREGTLQFAGRCNRTAAVPRRVLNADIG